MLLNSNAVGQICIVVHGHKVKPSDQCDQIGQLIGLWATFEAFGKKNLPKSSTFLGNFC